MENQSKGKSMQLDNNINIGDKLLPKNMDIYSILEKKNLKNNN